VGAALAALDRAAALAPGVPEVVCSRAAALSAAGRHAEACAAFERVVAAHPAQPAFRKGLADVLPPPPLVLIGHAASLTPY
jgi:predicted Zn-dependent protease